VQRSASAKKANATRQGNEARSAAKSTRASARRTSANASTTARRAAGTAAASANAAETRLEGLALTAERGLLIGVGAALVARDNVVETVKPYTRTETAQKELGKLQRKAKVDVRKFERRGTTARNRLEREVKRTRTRVERQLRQASGDVRNGNLTKVPTRIQTAATAVAQDVSKQVTSLV
jgi:hypothetical protein